MKRRLLLRDLSRLGEMSIHCDTRPAAARPDGSGSGLFLLEDLGSRPTRAKKPSAQVFEFAEWDCDLEVKQRMTPEARSVQMPESDAMPMQPVPFDLAALDDEACR